MDFQNLFTAKKGQVERYGSGDLPTGGSGVNFGGHKERWVLAEPKKLWKERQKNSDAFRESLNNRACFSNLSYFHGTCNIFQPCSGCAGLPGHTLPSGLRRGNTVQKHNEPWWLYFKMSFIMECYQILPFFACVACYVSYEFAAFDAKGIVALVNSHKEALKGKNFQQVQSIRSKLCVWKADTWLC